MTNEELIDAVLDQITDDLIKDDLTAIEELLNRIPRKHLIAYLPEEKQNA